MSKFLPPTYPKEALKVGIGGVVDIDVLIDLDGTTKTIRSVTSEPKNVAFEEATRLALKYWRFGVPKSDRCIPYETLGEVRLTFEAKNGEGVISLSHRKASQFDGDSSKVAPILLNRPELTANIKANYPFFARKNGGESDVHALITIDSASGEPSSVEVTEVRKSSGYQESFRAATVRSLMTSRYGPFVDRTKPWKKCFRIRYRLSDEYER